VVVLKPTTTKAAAARSAFAGHTVTFYNVSIPFSATFEKATYPRSIQINPGLFLNHSVHLKLL
jgi:hypothetical protein